MQTVTQLDPLRAAVDALKSDGPLAFVPTMGALHEGHLTLVREAKKRAAHVAVSIFVNPRQFGANEDLDKYPRRMAADAALLEAEGVSLLWAPEPAEMYPEGFATNVSVGDLGSVLCGAARPGHFDGVATVVLKLFNQVRPDLALFGEKDWQQLMVIRRMARDLDLTLPRAESIVGVPTVREPDGLALSSRNAYLTPDQRTAAACLPRAMDWAVREIVNGAAVAPTLLEVEELLLSGGFDSIDYITLCDAASLAPIDALAGKPARLLVAARIGAARLIDNKAV